MSSFRRLRHICRPIRADRHALMLAGRPRRFSSTPRRSRRIVRTSGGKGENNQAIGRSGGGRMTKIHALTDAARQRRPAGRRKSRPVTTSGIGRSRAGFTPVEMTGFGGRGRNRLQFAGSISLVSRSMGLAPSSDGLSPRFRRASACLRRVASAIIAEGATAGFRRRVLCRETVRIDLVERVIADIGTRD